MTGELYDNCRHLAGRGPKAHGHDARRGRRARSSSSATSATPRRPIGGTKQLAEDLASGVLLTSDHDGHGTYFAGSPCVDSAVDGYLIKGTVPASDQAC